MFKKIGNKKINEDRYGGSRFCNFFCKDAYSIKIGEQKLQYCPNAEEAVGGGTTTQACPKWREV